MNWKRRSEHGGGAYHELPTLLQEEITRLATERGISPSQLVKE